MELQQLTLVVEVVVNMVAQMVLVEQVVVELQEILDVLEPLTLVVVEVEALFPQHPQVLLVVLV